jgi:hypothetical protein
VDLNRTAPGLLESDNTVHYNFNTGKHAARCGVVWWAAVLFFT